MGRPLLSDRFLGPYLKSGTWKVIARAGYSRAEFSFDTEAAARLFMSLATPRGAPLWRRATKPLDGCWMWRGSTNGPGYGWITLYGARLHTHRAAWELVHGPIPPGAVVMHKCDTPACIRPDHLELGTQASNQLDKLSKGRQSRGETSGTAKLTEAAVRQIRIRHAAGVSVAELAEENGVSRRAIDHVVHRRRWRHVA